ncbi:MAG: DNA recombination protein RmuC [Bacillota bacterium]|nr:DNA recombination protein RmuC [Bacillota bacterium]MDW7676234.1 DNA recombination protein RmuC [Bacillota bacterium]
METMVQILLGLGTLQLLMLLYLMISSKGQKKRADQIRGMLQKTEGIDQRFTVLERQLREEGERNREVFSRNEKEARQELTEALRQYETSTVRHLEQLRTTSRETARENRDEMSGSLKALTISTELRLEQIREVMEKKIRELQQDNNAKLEQMRETVDEKLHKTLEHRLGESFKQVSDRLEQVHQGLGEMQTLASGVGDLKKVLSNVKTRGILGEYQLENLLDQLLTQDQYTKNVATRPESSDRVEFAVKMPGRQDLDASVWLPIDAKFPTEDYQQLLDAYETGNAAAVDQIQRKLAIRIKSDAKNIRDKYIEPPYTTDFGILFLPFEGLYAEVLRLDLFEVLQREYKVMIAGPTTISAFLNSLQMGFRTLAIEKRSSEVWRLLGAVKGEFGKFGGILDKTKKKLDEAGRAIDTAGSRSRVIERRLREVEELPQDTSRELLGTDFDEIRGEDQDKFHEE